MAAGCSTAWRDLIRGCSGCAQALSHPAQPSGDRRQLARFQYGEECFAHDFEVTREHPIAQRCAGRRDARNDASFVFAVPLARDEPGLLELADLITQPAARDDEPVREPGHPDAIGRFDQLHQDLELHLRDVGLLMEILLDRPLQQGRTGNEGRIAGELIRGETCRIRRIVINATPGGGAVELLQSIGAEVLGDKVLLDVSNAVGPDLTLIYPNDSIARRIQEAFPNLKVVKSLNTMNTSVMTDPAGLGSPTTVFVSGDDADAKATVTGVLSDLGWPASAVLDLGGIETARATEHYFYLFFATLMALGTPTFNVSVTR